MTKNNQTTNISSMTEDARLIARLLLPDRRAAQEFYDRFAPRLFRFIRRKIASEQDVEEIAQDTLFAFLEGIRDFTGRSSLNTYLCSIAANKIVDFYRKKRLARIVFSQLPEGLEPLISELADPQKILDNSLLRQKIISVLSRLSPRYRKIIHLKYIEGRSVVEIARILSLSFKSAESILFRARKAFVKIYVTGDTSI